MYVCTHIHSYILGNTFQMYAALYIFDFRDLCQTYLKKKTRARHWDFLKVSVTKRLGFSCLDFSSVLVALLAWEKLEIFLTHVYSQTHTHTHTMVRNDSIVLLFLGKQHTELSIKGSSLKKIVNKSLCVCKLVHLQKISLICKLFAF